MDSRSSSGETWNYIRMSTDLQEDSPTTQDDHTGQFIAAQGLTSWTRTYYDLAETAGSMEKRPGILQLLMDAEQHRPAVIIFFKLDRAFRNSAEQGVALRRLKKLGVRILKVQDPNVEGPQGELIDNILGSVNEFERRLVGTRIRAHNQTMARQGYWAGGPAPYGYRYVPSVREQHGRKKVTVSQGRLEPDPVEWPIAQQIWAWALAGQRKTEIATAANAAGYRRRRGGLWGAEEISRILASRIYAGFVPYSTAPRTGARDPRHWHDTEWYPGQHQAMVTMEEYLRVQALMHAPAGTHRRPNRQARAELAGLIRCRLCGGPVTSSGRDASNRYYYGCGQANRGSADHPYWNRAPWVVHSALGAVLDEAARHLPEVPPTTTGDADRAVIQREIARLQTQRKRLRELYLMGEFEDDREEYDRRRRQLDTQIAARQAALAQAGPTPTELGARWDLLRHWDELYAVADTVPKRQQLWALLVESVRMDQTYMVVHLRDLGPDVPQEWSVGLPPPKTRRPGSPCGRGIAGQRGGGRKRSHSWFERVGLAPVPSKP